MRCPLPGTLGSGRGAGGADITEQRPEGPCCPVPALRAEGACQLKIGLGAGRGAELGQGRSGAGRP